MSRIALALSLCLVAVAAGPEVAGPFAADQGPSGGIRGRLVLGVSPPGGPTARRRAARCVEARRGEERRRGVVYLAGAAIGFR